MEKTYVKQAANLSGINLHACDTACVNNGFQDSITCLETLCLKQIQQQT